MKCFDEKKNLNHIKRGKKKKNMLGEDKIITGKKKLMKIFMNITVLLRGTKNPTMDDPISISFVNLQCSRENLNQLLTGDILTKEMWNKKTQII